MFREQMDYKRRVIQRSDGTTFLVAEVTVPKPYHLSIKAGIDEDRDLKLQNVAHLRYLKALSRGVLEPVIIAWDAYPQSDFATVPSITAQSDRLVRISNNSLITTALRKAAASKNLRLIDGKLEVVDIKNSLDQIAAQMITRLYAEDRIKVLTKGPLKDQQTLSLDSKADIVAVGPVGYPSNYARRNNLPLAFNGSYFLYEEADYASEFSLFGEMHGLHIEAGQIVLPPLFKRSALLIAPDGSAKLQQVGLTDLSVHCLGSTWPLADFSLNRHARHSVYTRFYGVNCSGKTLLATPAASEKIEFIIIGQSIVGYKKGGQTPIPQNGWVLSLPLTEVKMGKFDTLVKYEFASKERFSQAIQGGPGLIKDGKIILNERSLVEEEFFRKKERGLSQTEQGVVPTDYAEDIDQTRAARTAVGVGFKGELIVIGVESVNRGMQENKLESTGATLLELAQVGLEKGAKHLLNLDGGGSANIVYNYGHLLRFADRRGLPGILYERMVPSLGIVHL